MGGFFEDLLGSVGSTENMFHGAFRQHVQPQAYWRTLYPLRAQDKCIAFGVHQEPVFEIQPLAIRTLPEDQPRRTR